MHHHQSPLYNTITTWHRSMLGWYFLCWGNFQKSQINNNKVLNIISYTPAYWYHAMCLWGMVAWCLMGGWGTEKEKRPHYCVTWRRRGGCFGWLVKMVNGSDIDCLSGWPQNTTEQRERGFLISHIEERRLNVCLCAQNHIGSDWKTDS